MTITETPQAARVFIARYPITMTYIVAAVVAWSMIGVLYVVGVL